MKLITQILAGNCEAVIQTLKNDPQAIKACDNEGNTPWFIAARSNRVDILEALFKFCKTGIFEPNKNGIIPLTIAVKAGSHEAAHFLEPENLVRLYLQNEVIQEVSWSSLLICIENYSQIALFRVLNMPIVLNSKEEVHPLKYIIQKCRDVNVLRLTLKRYHDLIQITAIQFNEICDMASNYQRQVLQGFKDKLLGKESQGKMEDIETVEDSNNSLNTTGPAYHSRSPLLEQSASSSSEEKPFSNTMIDEQFDRFSSLAFVPDLQSSQSSQQTNIYSNGLDILSSSVMRKRPSNVVEDKDIDDRVKKKQKNQNPAVQLPALTANPIGFPGSVPFPGPALFPEPVSFHRQPTFQPSQLSVLTANPIGFPGSAPFSGPVSFHRQQIFQPSQLSVLTANPIGFPGSAPFSGPALFPGPVSFHRQPIFQPFLVSRVDQNRNLAIIKAVRDPKKVAQLISDGVDLTPRNQEGHTVLSLAVKWGILETFKIVNKYFPLTGTYGPHRDSLMMIALKSLNSGSISTSDFENKKKNLLEIIDILIASSNDGYIDINILDLKSEIIDRTLGLALCSSSLRIIHFFCSKGLYPLKWVSEEYGPLIHLIIDGVTIKYDQRIPGALEDAQRMLRALINNGANINEADAKGQSIAHKVVDIERKIFYIDEDKIFVRYRMKFLEILMGFFPDISLKDNSGNTVIMVALKSLVKNKSTREIEDALLKIVDRLLDSNPGHKDVNRDILGPEVVEGILECAISGKSEKLLNFIATDPNTWTNKKGGPWMHSIVRYCRNKDDYPRLLNLALSKGIGINAVNKYNETILHEAVSIRGEDFLEDLRKKDKAQSRNGLIKDLIDRKADITIQSDTGQTAFHIALNILVNKVKGDYDSHEKYILQAIMLCRILIHPEVVFLRPPRVHYYSLRGNLDFIGKEYKNYSMRSKAIQFLQFQIQCYEVGLLNALIKQYFVEESIQDYEVGIFEVINAYLFGEKGTQKALKGITRNKNLLTLLRTLFRENRVEQCLNQVIENTKLVKLFRNLFGEQWQHNILNQAFDEENQKHFKLLKGLFTENENLLTLLRTLFRENRVEQCLNQVIQNPKRVELLRNLFGEQWQHNILNQAFDEEIQKHYKLLKELFTEIKTEVFLAEISKETKLVEFLQGLFGDKWQETVMKKIPVSVKEYKRHLDKAEKVACDVWSRHSVFKPKPSSMQKERSRAARYDRPTQSLQREVGDDHKAEMKMTMSQ